MLQLSDITRTPFENTIAVRDPLDAVIAILDDAHRELGARELADLGILVEAYIEEVVSRPTGCAIPVQPGRPDAGAQPR
jgi:hypothetical protein